MAVFLPDTPNRRGRPLIRGWKALRGRVDNRSRVQLWRDIRAGRFPAPIQLGPNSVAWFEDEVEDWKLAQPRRIYKAPNATSGSMNNAAERHGARRDPRTPLARERSGPALPSRRGQARRLDNSNRCSGSRGEPSRQFSPGVNSG